MADLRYLYAMSEIAARKFSKAMSSLDTRWVRTLLLNVRVNNDLLSSSRTLYTSSTRGGRSLPSMFLARLILILAWYAISVASILNCPIFLNTVLKSEPSSCRRYLAKKSSMDFDRYKKSLNARLCRAFCMVNQSMNAFNKPVSLTILALYQPIVRLTIEN